MPFTTAWVTDRCYLVKLMMMHSPSHPSIIEQNLFFCAGWFLCVRACLRAGAWKKRYWTVVTLNHLWRCSLGNDFVSESILYHLWLITQSKGCWHSGFGCLARCISLSTTRRKIISPVWPPVTFITWHYRNFGVFWNCWCRICCRSAMKLELHLSRCYASIVH